MKMTSEDAEILRNATLKQLSFALLARDLWNYYGPTPVGVAKISSLVNYADEVGEDFVTRVMTMAFEGKLRDWCSEHRLVSLHKPLIASNSDGNLDSGSPIITIIR